MKNKVIVDFIKKHWLGYAGGVAFLILNAYIQTFAPRILGKIIDLLRSGATTQKQILTYTAGLVIAALAAAVTRYIWRAFIMGGARTMECYLRERLFDHFQKLSVEFYNNRKTGDLMAYAVNDISAVRQTFGPGVARLVNGVGIGAVSVLAMIGTANARLTFLALLPIPFIIIIMLKIGQIIQKRFRTVQENFGLISDRVQEGISGIRVIKSYVQEDREIDNFKKLNNQMKAANIRMVWVSSLLAPITEVCFGLSFAVNLIFGSQLVKEGVITLGDFVAFNAYLGMIMAPVASIGRIISVFQKGMASLNRLNEIFNIEPEIKDSDADLSISEIKGAVEIKDLTYCYPGANEPALKDISLKLEKGQILGIIGKTGSGKTTLVNLLLKLYNVEKGKIAIDGKDINNISLQVLRENIGYVPQDNFLFSAAIGDNIKFFKDTYSDEAMEAASKASLIYQSIMEFPDKFKTLIGERGVNLSGGQKQRISIARAIIKNPSILILDDALSAVDTQTEEAILKNLRQVMSDKTGIIITHRISAIKYADHIIVMDHGEIIERGAHEQLITNGKLYAALYEEQFKNEQGGEAAYEIG